MQQAISGLGTVILPTGYGLPVSYDSPNPLKITERDFQEIYRQKTPGLDKFSVAFRCYPTRAIPTDRVPVSVRYRVVALRGSHPTVMVQNLISPSLHHPYAYFEQLADEISVQVGLMGGPIADTDATYQSVYLEFSVRGSP